MIQKAQRGGEARQTERKPEQQAKERAQKARLDPAAALTALMGGMALGQIPQQAALELQAGVGNSALLALLQKRANKTNGARLRCPKGRLPSRPFGQHRQNCRSQPRRILRRFPFGGGRAMEV